MSTKTRNRSKASGKGSKKAVVQPTLPESMTNGTSSPSEVASPTIEQIRMRAYELFLARGGAHGDDLSDWLEAERQLQQVTSKHM